MSSSSKATNIANIKKYFETPQQGLTANPKYAAFVYELLEHANPWLSKPVAGFSREGDVNLSWSQNNGHLSLTIRLPVVDSDDENEKGNEEKEYKENYPDNFDIIITYFLDSAALGHFDGSDLSYSDKDKIAALFETFSQSTTWDELINTLDLKRY